MANIVLKTDRDYQLQRVLNLNVYESAATHNSDADTWHYVGKYLGSFCQGFVEGMAKALEELKKR
jgi:hypothetical protein